MPEDNDSLKISFRDALTKLRGLLGNTGLQKSTDDKRFPEIFIVFDEAHPLTKPFNSQTANNDFAELRRALSSLRNISLLFTFFLSTTGKMTQFTPPRGHDSSNRMNDGTLSIPTPFNYLPFDELMGNHKIFEVNKTLDDVTSLECIAHMGRPL
jgi:hypothetical protein